MPETPTTESEKPPPANGTSPELPFRPGQRIFYHGDARRNNVPVTFEGPDKDRKFLFRVTRIVDGRERHVLASRGDLSAEPRQ